MSDVAALEVRDLHKYFGTHEVLKGHRYDGPQGRCDLPHRLSGSGKSTFYAVSICLKPPSSGSVSCMGS